MLLYIGSYYVLICMFTYRRHKIAICPKLAAPQLRLYFWNSGKYLSGRYALQFSHYFTRTIRGHRLDEKVDMISICSYLQKSHLKSLRYLLAYVAQYLINFITYYKSSIFRYAYEMIHQYRYVMTLANKLCHELIRTTTTNTPQAAGY